MIVRFTKGCGKPDTLTCLRADGSQTWSRLNDPTHDFGHYALEKTLGWRQAFFGLLAQGWNVEDFGRVDATTGRKPVVPMQALQAEALVGLLDIEGRSGRTSADAAFTEMLAYSCAGLKLLVPEITPQQLDIIRLCRAELCLRWRRIPAGRALQLDF